MNICGSVKNAVGIKHNILPRSQLLKFKVKDIFAY
jgi:hypothetical protein